MMDWGSGGGEWNHLVMIDQKVAAAVTTKKIVKSSPEFRGLVKSNYAYIMSVKMKLFKAHRIFTSLL